MCSFLSQLNERSWITAVTLFTRCSVFYVPHYLIFSSHQPLALLNGTDCLFISVKDLKERGSCSRPAVSGRFRPPEPHHLAPVTCPGHTVGIFDMSLPELLFCFQQMIITCLPLTSLLHEPFENSPVASPYWQPRFYQCTRGWVTTCMCLLSC